MIKKPDISVLSEKYDDLQHKKYPDGSSYYGQFKGDVRHGFGTYTHKGGDEYKGAWLNGKYNGHGIYTYANGDIYVGEWKNDSRMRPRNFDCNIRRNLRR